MCIAVPGKIVNIQGDWADVDFGGVSKKASLRLVKDPAVGDHVLVHAGFVIQILDQDAGEELEKLLEEVTAFAD